MLKHVNVMYTLKKKSFISFNVFALIKVLHFS